MSVGFSLAVAAADAQVEPLPSIGLQVPAMLDSRTEAAVLENLRDVTAGRSTIVIAHRLSSVVHADEIVVIESGQVRERGRHEELLDKRGQYASLWRQHMSGTV